eukprot:XP_766091.1 hypothetical protein [Theileria parva strain Muguga]
MCPNSQEPSRLTATSVMSYKAVTASKPKQLPDAPRKGTAFRANKKPDKNTHDWHITHETLNLTHKLNLSHYNPSHSNSNNSNTNSNNSNSTNSANSANSNNSGSDGTTASGNTPGVSVNGVVGSGLVNNIDELVDTVNSLNGNMNNSLNSVHSLDKNMNNDNFDKAEHDFSPFSPFLNQSNHSNSLNSLNSVNTNHSNSLTTNNSVNLNHAVGTVDREHAVLTEDELATFRTSFCTKHHQNKCPNSDSCEKSHCLTWQRRNPYEISYCPHLCPNIQFVKKSRKMVLYRRCTRGKNCNFAHSKEEELYHPLVYKTKQCSSYPKCSRYFCPFIHEPSELRDVSRFKHMSTSNAINALHNSNTAERINNSSTMDRVNVDRVNVDRVNVDRLNVDRVNVDRVNVDRVSVDRVNSVKEEEKVLDPVDKEKEELVETSFEFDCLDTMNGPDTFRDSFTTGNSFDSNNTNTNANTVDTVNSNSVSSGTTNTTNSVEGSVTTSKPPKTTWDKQGNSLSYHTLYYTPRGSYFTIPPEGAILLYTPKGSYLTIPKNVIYP